MPDFSLSPEIRDLRKRVRDFMDEHIYPNETFFMDEHTDAGKRADLMKDLQARTKAKSALTCAPSSASSDSGTNSTAFCALRSAASLSPATASSLPITAQSLA